MDTNLRLATLREVAASRPLPGLTIEASRRRYSLLARNGTLPPGVVVRLGKRVFLDPVRLETWLAAGGTAAHPVEPEQTVTGGAL